VWAGGGIRLHNAGTTEAVPGITLRIVQANVAQLRRWEPEARTAVLQKNLEMTRGPGFENITHVIWPESSVPYFIDPGSTLVDILQQAVPPGGALITGGLRREEESGITGGVWNTLFAITHGGIATYYDKHHLVPFGEYVPLRQWLPLPIEKLAHDMGDFSVGPGPQTLTLKGFVPFSPLICYEAIFPDKVIAGNMRPSVLVNVTNDAWFGVSTGPYQHYQMARLRAVEEGIPLIRAANTGISGVIDAYGREVATADLNKNAVVDSLLPVALETGTAYSKIRGITFLLLVIIPSLCVMIFPRIL